MSVVIDGTSGITFPDSSSQSAAAASGYPSKAWVNFNGTGTVAIRDSGNVSSLTDNAVGDYTVNFSSAVASANYTIGGTTNTNGTDCAMCVMGPDAASRAGALSTFTSSAVRVSVGGKYGYASASDGTFVGVQVLL